MGEETFTEQTYVEIFLNSAFARGNFLGALSLFFLFIARMFPIIALAPFFGARVLPHPVKVAFGISLFVIFLPQLLLVTETPLTFNPLLLIFLVKELFIGLILGFMVSIPFTIVQTAGMLIDHQRGGASLMVNDPTIQNQSSPLGTIFNLVLIYLFFFIDGPFLFIEAISHSFNIIPPDKFFNPNFFNPDANFFETLIELLNKVMLISIRFATPALMAIFMTDVFLGITNRLAPQVQITFLGLPLKSLLGLTVIFIGWKLMTTEMTKLSYTWVNQIINIINMFINPVISD